MAATDQIQAPLANGSGPSPIKIYKPIVIPPNSLLERIFVDKWDGTFIIEQLSDFVSLFDCIMDLIFQFYEQSKLMQAFRGTKALRNSFDFHAERLPEDPNIKSIRDKVSGLEEYFSQIQEEVSQLQKLIEELENNDGWTHANTTKGVTTYYRHEPSSPVHSLKMFGTIDMPMFNVLALFNETDLFVKWIPMMKESTDVKVVSMFRKYVYIRCAPPWPLSQRDMCLVGYCVDNLHDADNVLVYIRSCQGDELQLFPPVPPGTVRMDCHAAGILIAPETLTTTRVVLMSNADPKMAVVPYWFLNKVTQHFAYKMFETVQHTCKNFEASEHAKRIAAKPEIYQQVQQRLEEHFRKSPAPQPAVACVEQNTERDFVVVATTTTQPPAAQPTEAKPNGEIDDSTAAVIAALKSIEIDKPSKPKQEPVDGNLTAQVVKVKGVEGEEWVTLEQRQ